MSRFKIEENDSVTPVEIPREFSQPLEQPQQTQPTEDKFQVINLPPVNQVENNLEQEPQEFGVAQNYNQPQEQQQEEDYEPPHKLFGHGRYSQKKRSLQPTEIVNYERNRKPNYGLYLLGGSLIASVVASMI